MVSKHAVEEVVITYGDLQLVVFPQEIEEFNVFNIKQHVSFDQNIVSFYTADHVNLDIDGGSIRELGDDVDPDYLSSDSSAEIFDKYYYGECLEDFDLSVSVHFKPHTNLQPIRISLADSNIYLDGRASGRLFLTQCKRCNYLPECSCSVRDFL